MLMPSPIQEETSTEGMYPSPVGVFQQSATPSSAVFAESPSLGCVGILSCGDSKCCDCHLLPMAASPRSKQQPK